MLFEVYMVTVEKEVMRTAKVLSSKGSSGNVAYFIQLRSHFDVTHAHPVTCESSSDTACCAFWPH